MIKKINIESQLWFRPLDPLKEKHMGVLIELPAADYFGSCPKCGRNDGRLDIGPDHWCFCLKHKLKWWIGSARFSYWNGPAQDVWERNIKKLTGYREVKPLYRFPTRDNHT